MSRENKKIRIPADREIFEGEIATYWMDNGILVSLSKSPKRTVANITGNIAMVRRITGNKKTPLLIYLRNSSMPDNETREFVNKQLPNLYSAMAMISKPGLTKFIINFLFRLKPPPIPIKNFTNYKEAMEWLKQYL